MKKLLQNSGKIGKIIMSICEILLGVLLFINPKGLTSVIIVVIGIALIMTGIVYVIRYFRADPVSAHLEQGLAKALCALAVGLLCLFNSNWLIETFSFVIGVIVLFTGILRIQWTVDMLRMKTGRWYILGIGAVLSVAFGIIILLNPFAWTDFLWTFVAICMIVNAMFDLCAAFLTSSSD